MFLLPVPLYDYIIFNYCCYILFVTTLTLSMFLLLLLYHYMCFYFLQRFTWRQWRFNQQNGDQDYYVVVIYLFIYLFIYLSWINGWDDISVCEAKKPRYAVPIMEGYKKILLVAGGTQLGYVTAAYISCSLDTLSDHPSMGIPGRFFDGRICGSCHFYRYPAWQAAT